MGRGQWGAAAAHLLRSESVEQHHFRVRHLSLHPPPQLGHVNIQRVPVDQHEVALRPGRRGPRDRAGGHGGGDGCGAGTEELLQRVVDVGNDAHALGFEDGDCGEEQLKCQLSETNQNQTNRFLQKGFFAEKISVTCRAWKGRAATSTTARPAIRRRGCRCGAACRCSPGYCRMLLCAAINQKPSSGERMGRPRRWGLAAGQGRRLG